MTVWKHTISSLENWQLEKHDDVIKWKHFPHYWPFMRGIHQSLVDSPHKGQWRVALMISLISAWTNSWANNGDPSDMRSQCTHYDATVMIYTLKLKDNQGDNLMINIHRTVTLTASLYTMLKLMHWSFHYNRGAFNGYSVIRYNIHCL